MSYSNKSNSFAYQPNSNMLQIPETSNFVPKSDKEKESEAERTKIPIQEIKEKVCKVIRQITEENLGQQNPEDDIYDDDNDDSDGFMPKISSEKKNLKGQKHKIPEEKKEGEGDNDQPADDTHPLHFLKQYDPEEKWRVHHYEPFEIHSKNTQCGSFGSVKFITSLLKNQQYVSKEILEQRSFINELKVFQKIKTLSAYFPKFYGYDYKFDNEESIYKWYLSLERGDCNLRHCYTFMNFLEKKGNIETHQELIIFTIQILHQIIVLYQNGIVHRDIKPENIIIIGPYAILVDYGLSQVYDSETQKQKVLGGTPYFIAPEIQEDTQQNLFEGFLSDLYSFGKTLEQISKLIPVPDEILEIIKILLGESNNRINSRLLVLIQEVEFNQTAHVDTQIIPNQDTQTALDLIFKSNYKNNSNVPNLDAIKKQCGDYLKEIQFPRISMAFINKIIKELNKLDSNHNTSDDEKLDYLLRFNKMLEINWFWNLEEIQAHPGRFLSKELKILLAKKPETIQNLSKNNVYGFYSQKGQSIQFSKFLFCNESQEIREESVIDHNDIYQSDIAIFDNDTGEFIFQYQNSNNIEGTECPKSELFISFLTEDMNKLETSIKHLKLEPEVSKEIVKILQFKIKKGYFWSDKIIQKMFILLVKEMEEDEKRNFILSILRYSIQVGNIDIVERLLDQSPYQSIINVNEYFKFDCDESTDTLLATALESHHQNIAWFILKSFEQCFPEDQNLLKVYCEKENEFGICPFILAIINNFEPIVRKLIGIGVYQNVVITEETIKKIKTKFLEKDDNALIIATRNGYAELVALLLQMNADINYSNSRKWTAAHIAAQQGNQKIFSLLAKQKNFDFNKKTIDGETCLSLAANSPNQGVLNEIRRNPEKFIINPIELHTSIFQATRFGNYQRITQVLWPMIYEHGNSEVSFLDPDDQTVLFVSAELGNLHLVKFYLGKNIDMELKNKNGMNVFHITTEKGQFRVLQELFQHKIANKLLQDKDDQNRTPFLCSFQNPRLDIVKAYLKHHKEKDFDEYIHNCYQGLIASSVKNNHQICQHCAEQLYDYIPKIIEQVRSNITNMLIVSAAVESASLTLFPFSLGISILVGTLCAIPIDIKRAEKRKALKAFKTTFEAEDRDSWIEKLTEKMKNENNGKELSEVLKEGELYKGPNNIIFQIQ